MLLSLGCTFSHCGLELVHQSSYYIYVYNYYYYYTNNNNNRRSIGSQWRGEAVRWASRCKSMPDQPPVQQEQKSTTMAPM